ncbi:hypothetical protein [Aeromicrobium erythreum]|uniref:PH domain-containing protein n=1 Tax=Aeromicrobium erythreum TaxID=2041 RepID=A0A0U3KMW0_9ACTN|nr:hypothetical protein [Aeromicrobium erythreum]ALX05971.1 hypothetical protein AERYTH_15325 [Aeromicrobium erythreum]
MAVTQELRPGPWGWAERRRRIAASGAVLAVAVGLLLLAGRGTGLLGVLLIAVPTVVVTVPSILLYERLTYQRESLVITARTLEMYRGDRLLHRLDRTAPIRALRFRLSASGHPFGLPKLLLHDGRDHVRLASDRWLVRHEQLLTALGVEAPTVDHRQAQQLVPDAFPLWERRPNLVAGLSVLGLLVAIVAVPVVGALLTA